MTHCPPCSSLLRAVVFPASAARASGAVNLARVRWAASVSLAVAAGAGAVAARIAATSACCAPPACIARFFTRPAKHANGSPPPEIVLPPAVRQFQRERGQILPIAPQPEEDLLAKNGDCPEWR